MQQPEVVVIDGMIDATLMCKSSGKRWSHYYENACTKAFIAELVTPSDGSLGVPLARLIRQNRRGLVDTRRTLVHPRLAADLRHWLARSARKAIEQYVYAATSDILDGVKIGLWNGTPSRLLTRYRTVYGASVRVVFAPVVDSAECEASLLCLFRPWNLSGELFDKACCGVVWQTIERLQ